MSDELQKKTPITIFSTRFIASDDEDNPNVRYLFTNTNKKYSNFLQNYYIKLDDVISKLLNEESDVDKNRLAILLKKRLVTESLGRSLKEGEWEKLVSDNHLTENVKRENGQLGETLRWMLTTFDKNELDEDMELFETIYDSIDIEIADRMILELQERVEKWGLTELVVGLVCDNDKRIYTYQLSDENVYAVWCPENDSEKDSDENSWIPCLLDCAHELTKKDNTPVPLDIRLVLHDKDLGESNKKYAGRFTFLDNREVRTRGLDCGHLNPQDECKILFFMHTVGGIVDLLKPKGNALAANKVHDEVTRVMENYGTLGEIRKKGTAVLANPDALEKCRGELNKELHVWVEQEKREKQI